MSSGVFVDIRQQNGQQVRMEYPLTKDSYRFCFWVARHEADAEKYRKKPADESEATNEN